MEYPTGDITCDPQVVIVLLKRLFCANKRQFTIEKVTHFVGKEQLDAVMTYYLRNKPCKPPASAQDLSVIKISSSLGAHHVNPFDLSSAVKAFDYRTAVDSLYRTRELSTFHFTLAYCPVSQSAHASALN